jgi:hypothetical protein
MEGHCPQCRVRLEFPASGTYLCQHCKMHFDVHLGSPRPVYAGVPTPMPGMFPPAFPGMAPAGTLPAPTLDAAVQAPCAQHPANPAQFVCERCGDFMCRLCTTPTEGRLYCPKCFDLLYSRGALHFAQRQFTLPGVTFGLGLGGFIISLIGCACVPLMATLPLGIAGIWTGLRTYKEYRERPELPGRGLTTSGMVFSVLTLLVSIGWIVFWAVQIARNP